VTRWRPIAATIVSLLGLAVATYLTYSHYSNPSASRLTCPFGSSGSSEIDCGAVLTSGYSSILGLPVALYGAVFFLFMVGINLPFMWRSESLLVARLRLAAAVAGMAMVLYLVGVELLGVHHICIWCTSVHFLQFVLFLIVITGWYDTGWAASEWAEDEAELAPGHQLSASPRSGVPGRSATG
jgi:uncharacterized membrane protein